jgi:hypothetical protein
MSYLKAFDLSKRPVLFYLIPYICMGAVDTAKVRLETSKVMFGETRR